LAWEEKDLEGLMEKEKRESGVRDREKGEENVFQQVKREKWIRVIRYFATQNI
jgi:hypothetical protein